MMNITFYQLKIKIPFPTAKNRALSTQRSSCVLPFARTHTLALLALIGQSEAGAASIETAKREGGGGGDGRNVHFRRGRARDEVTTACCFLNRPGTKSSTTASLPMSMRTNMAATIRW